MDIAFVFVLVCLVVSITFQLWIEGSVSIRFNNRFGCVTDFFFFLFIGRLQPVEDYCQFEREQRWRD